MYIKNFQANVCFKEMLVLSDRKHISKEKMAQIQSKIEQDRKMLESKKDMAEEERNQVKEDLEEKEMELKKYQ